MEKSSNLKEFSKEEIQIHKFIASKNGVTLTDILKFYNKKYEKQCTLAAMNSKLTALSCKDFKLYEDTCLHDVKKTDKKGKVTIKKQKDVLFFINKD